MKDEKVVQLLIGCYTIALAALGVATHCLATHS